MESIPYCKINTIWKRDDAGSIIPGDFSVPVFEYLANAEWLWTEKVDGTNIRVHWDGSAVSFGGRTDNAVIQAPLLKALQEQFDTPDMFNLLTSVFGEKSTTLYGEGCGSSIQKGGARYGDKCRFVMFDVMCNGFFLEMDNVLNIAKQLNVQAVPIVGSGSLWDADSQAKYGIASTYGDFKAEGLVIRPIVDLQDRRGRRIIAKIKTRDYALRNKGY